MTLNSLTSDVDKANTKSNVNILKKTRGDLMGCNK